MSPGSSTEKPDRNPPGRGTLEPAGSSSQPAWLRSRCCGRRGEPSAAPSGSPGHEKRTYCSGHVR